MKKRLLALSTLVLASAGVYGQQDIALTHFIYNKMLFNPAAAGIDEGVCGTLTYRNQWDKVNGAPNSALFNAEANIERWFPAGVGISFAHDAIGFNRQNNLLLNYSQHIVTGSGTLGIGVGVGMVNFGLDPNWVPPSTLIDPSLPAKTSATTLDLNAGLYWKGATKPYYIGLSSTHLSAPDIAQASILGAGSSVSYNTARHYYVMGGYTIEHLGPGDLDLQAMMRTDLVKYSVDINARYIVNKMFYGGLTYRTSDAIAVMAGFMIDRKFVVGYSYDLTLNKLSSVSRGTHELMVKYCYFIPPAPVQKSKHPRWL